MHCFCTYMYMYGEKVGIVLSRGHADVMSNITGAL